MIVVVVVMRMTLIRPLVRSAVVRMIRTRRVAVRVRVARATLMIGVPMLAHGISIRRLRRVGQHVKPCLSDSPA
jgi:hypothetical protein